MEGGSGPDGLCYRAFEELFNIRDSRCESGRMSYSIKVSMLEIYNEQVGTFFVSSCTAASSNHILSRRPCFASDLDLLIMLCL